MGVGLADLLGERNQVVAQLGAGGGGGHPSGEAERERGAFKRTSVAGVWVGGVDELVDQNGADLDGVCKQGRDEDLRATSS
ncbi:MAG TPA: hypothetical protein VKF59_14355 [Candidatus Dormibacteraeota bacterium]|nr:hypothetical protein [Candidatus Dormibacteraeota bacterium]